MCVCVFVSCRFPIGTHLCVSCVSINATPTFICPAGTHITNRFPTSDFGNISTVRTRGIFHRVIGIAMQKDCHPPLHHAACNYYHKWIISMQIMRCENESQLRGQRTLRSAALLQEARVPAPPAWPVFGNITPRSLPLPSFVSRPSLVPPSSLPRPSLVPPSSLPCPSLVPPSSLPRSSLVPLSLVRATFLRRIGGWGLQAGHGN